MIKNITIENFRCFKDLKVSKFAQVNLISGKNNAGKTALLEAIFLNVSSRPNAIYFLRKMRREQADFSKILPEKTWDNFFFQQNKSDGILIKVDLKNDSSKLVRINTRGSIYDVPNGDYQTEDEDDYQTDVSLTSETESVISPIYIRSEINGQTFSESRIISSPKGLTAKHHQISELERFPIQNAVLIPSFLTISNRDLTAEFDTARLNGKGNEVLKVFQAIDSSIETVESFSIGEPTLYLKRQQEPRLPLSLFGDAINRVAEITLKLVNNQSSVLLVDEIENGIHHSSQVDFWNFLGKLAHDLNVQVFATTHSLEMTQAFVVAGLNNPDMVAHFELARQARTDQIVAIRRDIETLEYSISHNKEVRGG